MQTRAGKDRAAERLFRQLSLVVVLLYVVGCNTSNRGPSGPSTADGIRDSAALFEYISRIDPLAEFVLFPNADEFTAGRLNGSEAHWSIVRVSMNARALDSLQNGRLPPGAQFRDGSVLLKEIRPRADGPVSVYAVMYKDSDNALAVPTGELPALVAINANKGASMTSSARSSDHPD